jgi:hypothetical protein
VGPDRLRLLVSPRLWQKFDRPRYLFNQAIEHRKFEDLRRQPGAWLTPGRRRISLRKRLALTSLTDGRVAAIVPNPWLFVNVVFRPRI